MTTEDAKTYLSKREIPRLFESLMTGLMFHRPSDHIQYLIDCLEKAKNNGQVTWNMFVEYKRTKTPLPPITPENGRRPGSRGRRSVTPKEEPRSLDESRGTPLPPIGNTDEQDFAKPKPVIDGLPNVPFVLVMGGPGSGKQVQIQRLMSHNDGWVHISLGELIRREVADKGSAEERWKMVRDLVMSGEMAPGDDACELFVEEVKRNQSAKGFIIEGYPRDMQQLEDYERTVGRTDMVIMIDCEERFLSQRLLKRGANNSRADDNIQAVQKRLMFFKEKTLPVIKYFDDQGKVQLIEGDQDVDDLSKEIISKFDNIIKGEPITTEPKVPAPPSEPRPERQRSARLRTPEKDLTDGQEVSIPDIPDIQDMAPAEINVKDEGRKSGLPDCPIMFLAGGPGSGKGTQCKKIVERYNDVVHLSMGDILRTEISTNGTADDKWGMIATLLQDGDMAPEDVTIDLLLSNIKKHPDARAFVIEGYPRDVRQVEEFNKNIGGLSFAVLLDCEEYYLQQRLIDRGADSGRPDDNLSAIGKRISFFRENTLPILKHYDDDGKLVVVMGDRDENDIFYEIAQTLDFALFGIKTELEPAVPPPTEDPEHEGEGKADDEQGESTLNAQAEQAEATPAQAELGETSTQAEQEEAAPATQAEQGETTTAAQAEQEEATPAAQAEQGETTPVAQAEQGEVTPATQAEQGETTPATQAEQGETTSATQAEQGETTSATQAEQGETTAEQEEKPENVQEETREPVVEVMVSETATVTGDRGNPEYSKQLDAAAEKLEKEQAESGQQNQDQNTQEEKTESDQKQEEQNQSETQAADESADGQKEQAEL